MACYQQLVSAALWRAVSCFSILWLGVLLAGCTPGHTVISIPLSDATIETMTYGMYEAGQEQFAIPWTPTKRVVIVPHHLTAAKGIGMGTASLSREDPQSILLLSPDHFGECPTAFCTGDVSFESKLGKTNPDPKMVQALRSSEWVTEKPELFKREHGITAVVPFLMRSLSGTTVTPVVASIVPQSAEKREAYFDLLKSVLQNDEILLVSSDFSHYLSLEQANEMDEETAKAIFSKDFDAIAKLKNPEQSDCPVCIWLAARIANDQDAYNPSVLLHSNSALILAEENIQETTSHFTIAFYQNDFLSGDDIAFGGDVTLTRPRTNFKLSPELNQFWSGTGARIVNLEGPLKKECEANSNPFIFCNLYDTWLTLKDIATHWGVENNHMYDQGIAGVEETKSLITEGGEEYVDIQGKLVQGMQVYTLTDLLNPVAESKWFAQEDYLAVINALSENDDSPIPQIVFLHGGTEYNALTNEEEMILYRSFIDTGADALIVTHTHVPGDVEFYMGAPIFRGIGNFIFDQYDAVATRTAKLIRLRQGSDSTLQFQTVIAQ